MRAFETIELDAGVLREELDALDSFLGGRETLRERAEIIPFFKARRQLCAALGLFNSDVAMADRVAVELDIFGDFVCDAASGDSEANAFTLVEFEDAAPYSVLSRLEKGKSMKRWSPRFERGFSQTVDWAWRLTAEGGTPAFRRIFGDDEPSIHFLLIVGKDLHLTPDDIKRLRWRAQNISIGGFKISYVTFDGVLATLRRRLLYASQTGAS